MTDTGAKKPAAGTLTKSTTSTTNATLYYGASKTQLQVGTNLFSWLRYALPADLRGTNARVDSAVLTGIPVGAAVQRHASLGRVSYSTMMGKNDPGLLSGSSPFVADATGTVDVTADVQAIADGGAYYGWRVSKSGTRVNFPGWQTTGAPRLRIVYSLRPAAPTQGKPAGQAVNAAAPVVQILDPDPELTGLWVQVDEYGGDGSTPLHDSGWQTTSVPSYDTAAGGWAGVADGVEWQWRAQQRTPRGDSDWSPWFTVPRDVLPGVAWVTVPASTADPTPLHEWAVTPAGEQEQFRLSVIDLATGQRLSGLWVPGDQDAYTPTAGPTRDGQQVRSVLEVLDRSDRVETPGDPGVVVLTHDWVLDLAAAGAPVTDFTVTQVDDSPLTRLAWEWPADVTGVPDSWQWGVGEDIWETFDGLDHRVGATNVWELDTWRMRPNVERPVWVAPVTDGVAGERRTFPYQMRLTGLHVVDESTGDHVDIDGNDGADTLAHVESSTVVQMLDGSEGSITTGLGGLAGPLTGFLRDRPAGTAVEQKDAWLRIREAGRVVRLVYDDVNIAAKLTGMTVGSNGDYARVDRRGYQVAARVSQRPEQPPVSVGS